MDKIKKAIIPVVAGLFILIFTVVHIVLPDKAISSTERRQLTQFPTISMETIQSGKFMSNFEKYALDQFPLRNWFRSIKAYVALYVFGEKENNDIYLVGDDLSKMDFPLNETAVTYAGSRFQLIYEKYCQPNNCNVFLSIVPDKNYFMAQDNGYLALDYEKLVSIVQESIPDAQYINLFDKLELSDFYKTDTHWRQEKITDVAAYLAEQMGTSLSGKYETVLASDKFTGVYYGQAALNLKKEPIYYVTNDTIQSCLVYDIENSKDISMYVMEKLETNDYYQMYLNGSISLIKITNPNATTDRNLVLFRDSFGSSIAPLLAEGYATVTIVDVRYISPLILGRFVNFENADVLFLYNTQVLNNGTSLK